MALDIGFDTGWNFLDRALETGTTLAERYFDYGTARNEASAQAALRDAEAIRLRQVEALGQTSTIGGMNFPSWTIPAALGALALAFYLKKK